MAEGPRSVQPKFKEDFVLLTEFAEIKHGPKPLCVFPADGNGDFDINSFSVRVFSTDFQYGTDEGFTFTPDSQVLISESEEGAHAYVHYFALNDIEARGYVRQYCVSYITSSPNKLIDHFQTLLYHFTEVTRLFKCGNHYVFGEDLEHRIADLIYSLDIVEKLKVDEIDEGKGEKESFYYDSRFDDIPETNLEVLQRDLRYINTVTDVLKEEMTTGKNELVHQMLENEKQLSTTIKCGNSMFYSPDTSMLSLAKESYKPSRALAHISQRFSRQLRDLERLSVMTYSRAMATMRAIQRTFCRSDIVLAMEIDEGAMIAPCSSLLSVGRVPMLNLLHKWSRQGSEAIVASHAYRVTSAQCLQRPFCPDETSSSVSTDLIVRDRDPNDTDCVFDTSFLLYNDKTDAPLYLDPLPRKRGTSIFDPLATPGLPSSSTARLSTLQPPIFFPPRPASRESAYETPESFSYPHSPASGSRESIKARTSVVKNDTSNHRAHSYPPPDVFCSEVSDKLKMESERQNESDRLDEEETEVMIESEPSSGTVVENGVVRNGDCSSDGLRIVGRTRSLAVSDVLNRIGNISGSDSENDSAMLGRRDAMEYSSSQYSEFSPVPPEEGEGTAGVGRLEDSYMATKQLADRRSHSSSGSFGSSLNRPRTDSRSQASNRSSSDSSHLVNAERKKPQLRLKFHSSSQSIPDDKYFTPAASVAGFMFSPNYPPPPPISTPYSPPPSYSEQEMEVSLLASCYRFPFVSSFDLTESRRSLIKPGKDLLTIFKDLPEARDLFYTLLRGRTLVIIGSSRDANAVRRHIHALWLFVPGHSKSHQVIPLQTTPLRLNQLPHVKLMGICTDKQPALSEGLKRYVSWWDWTTNTLSCPTYSGVLLNPILNRGTIREKKSDETFIALVLSTFNEISMRAYLYYHAFCIKPDHEIIPSLSITRSVSEVSPRKKHSVSSRNGKSSLFDFINVKDGDADIVEYLVDVVKRQQLLQWRGLFSSAGPSIEDDPPTLTLHHQSYKERILKPKLLKRSSRV